MKVLGKGAPLFDKDGNQIPRCPEALYGGTMQCTHRLNHAGNHRLSNGQEWADGDLTTHTNKKAGA